MPSGATWVMRDKGEKLTYNRVWMKAEGTMPDDPVLHAAALVYSSDTTVLDSIITWNAGPGIRFEGGDALGGVKPATVGRSTLTANAGGNASAQWQGPGAVIELGANVCGSDTSCP